MKPIIVAFQTTGGNELGNGLKTQNGDVESTESRYSITLFLTESGISKEYMVTYA